MYCPKCGAEFRADFTRCAECDVELVDSLPEKQEPEYVDLVTVFEGDSNGATVATATLSNSNIESYIKNEGIQGIFPSLGPAEVQVSAGDESVALEVLGASNQGTEVRDEESV